MDQITKLYNEIVAHDPSLAAHKDKIFSLIEQMVEAKPTVSFDPHWKDAFDSKLAEHIANWQPATTAPFSYGWMTKRAMAVSSFFIIGAVTAAGIWYIQVEHKQQQKIAMTKSTQVEQSSESEANTSLALRDGDTSVQNPEALSDIASDSIMNVNADLPPGQLKKSTKVAVTPPGLIDKWSGQVGMTMMATPAIAPDMDPNISAVGKIAIVFLTSDALDISNSFSVPTFEVSDEMHLKSALVFTTKVNILRPADGQMRNGKKIVDGLVKSLQAKNVIILHLNYPTSVAVAQDLIAELQAKGYAFVSLSELND